MDQEKLTERNEDQANTIWGQVKILFIVYIIVEKHEKIKLEKNLYILY